MRASAALLSLLLWTAVDGQSTAAPTASSGEGAPMRCSSPPPLANGDTTTSPQLFYEHGEKVEYACQRYYTMEGGPHRTCSNGEWLGDMTCLKPCTVDRDAMSRNNIRFRYSDNTKMYSPHDDEIEFECRTGRPRGMRQRCVDGTMSLPTCV